MTSPGRTRAPWAVGLLGLLLAAPACGTKTKKKGEEKRDQIEYKGGIAIIPRGQVVRAEQKGGRFELVIRANVTVSHALTFYRRQLSRDRWTEITDARSEAGHPALSARLGTFELVGEVRRRGGAVEIRFVKRIDVAKQPSTRPKVPRDVVVLAAKVLWEGQLYGSGTRVELRGQSPTAVGKLLSPIEAALKQRGWEVARATGPGGQEILRANKGKKRKLEYRFDATKSGTRLALELSPDEFAAPGTTPTGMTPAKKPDAGAPPAKATENLVAVPKELRLWKGLDKKKGVKQGPLHLFTFDRECKSPTALGQMITRKLRRSGYKQSVPVGLGAAATGDAGAGLALTYIKGRNRMIIATIRKEGDLCVIEFTVKPK